MMKCYTVRCGGQVVNGINLTVEGAIAVGEEGRGRKLVIVPVSPESVVVNRYLADLPTKLQPAGSVMVLIKDQSGAHGSWSLSNRIGTLVVAEGACAQGDAGRVGGGPEYLMVFQPGGTATINRLGRLYGHPDTLRISNNDGVLAAENVKAAEDTRAASAVLAEL